MVNRQRHAHRHLFVNPRRQRDCESGLTIVFVALVLLVLMIFAAFVVDVGAVYNLRRQDQSAADSGALAAARDISNEASAVDAAKQYANETLGTPLDDATWNSCTVDTGALAVRATSANCISFDSARSRVRVRIPDQFHQTAFGGVVGVDQMQHSAFAIAGITRGLAGVLPFGITGAAGGGGHVCLKTGPAGANVPVCTGPTAGNFGFLSFSVHGTDGRTRACGNGGSDALTIENMAMGADHDFSLWGPSQQPHGTTAVNDEGCNLLPNYAEGNTGNTPNNLGAGIFSGGPMSDGLGPRLRRGSFGSRTTIEGKANVDDNPLWKFIDPSMDSVTADVPESCERSQFVNGSGAIDPTFPNVDEPTRTHILNLPGTGTAKRQNQMLKLLERCFDHYRGLTYTDFGAVTPEPPGDGPDDGCSGPCDDPVFALNSSGADAPDLFDIQYTPRFGYVPQLVCTLANPTATTGCLPFDNGSNGINRFADFRAIYIQRFCVGNNACDVEFDPGFGTTSSGNDARANSLTAFVFPKNMLPGGLGQSDAPFAVGKNRFVQLVR